jgi:hypothetical protein
MPTQMIVILITLVVAAAFFYIWKQRDTGKVSID